MQEYVFLYKRFSAVLISPGRWPDSSHWYGRFLLRRIDSQNSNFWFMADGGCWKGVPQYISPERPNANQIYVTLPVFVAGLT